MQTLVQIINLLNYKQQIRIYDYTDEDSAYPIYEDIADNIPLDILDCEVVAIRALDSVLEIELNVAGITLTDEDRLDFQMNL